MRWCQLSVVVYVLAISGPAGAEEATAAEETATSERATFHDFPTRFSRRPLVLDPGMVRTDGRVLVGGVIGDGTLSSLDIGGAVSPVEGLELGLSTRLTGAIPAPAGLGLVSIVFSPSASYGDIPVYARYQYHQGPKGFLAGVDLVLVLPSNTDFRLGAGVPMRVVELFEIFTIDMNVGFVYRNGDKFAAFTPVPSSNTFDFSTSGAMTVNLTDHGFVELGGGVGVANVNGGDGAKNIVELPFFVGGGFTLQRKVLVDFFSQFGFMPLMTANGPDGRDTFNVADDWFVTIGATVYTKPLFSKPRD